VRDRPDDFEATWKLSRIAYWLGGHASNAERRGFLEQGVKAGESARRLLPQRPEGHFWLAANMGALAELIGGRRALGYRKPIKEALETVLTMDPAFLNGATDRALGRWYFRVPRLFGGSNSQAEAHLRASLRYDPNSTLTHLFLADVLLDEDRTREARAELQAVIDAPLSADWAPEDADNKQAARERLARLR
jgi:hypothetical protein